VRRWQKSENKPRVYVYIPSTRQPAMAMSRAVTMAHGWIRMYCADQVGKMYIDEITENPDQDLADAFTALVASAQVYIHQVDAAVYTPLDDYMIYLRTCYDAANRLRQYSVRQVGPGQDRRYIAERPTHAPLVESDEEECT